MCRLQLFVSSVKQVSIKLILNVCMFRVERISSGKSFHNLEAATLKAWLPNLSLVCGTNKSSFVAERRDV